MKRCTRCVLPETFPGIQFDDQGVCQYCRRLPSPETRERQKSRLRQRFEKLVVEAKQRTGYHCLVSWSGGKDSTFTLQILQEEYGLRTLAFTFDNGFVSPGAFENMRAVTDALDIDHMIVKPSFDLLRRVFRASAEPGMYPPRALERASSICSTCMGLAKGIALRIALEQGITLLAYGWSPGQLPLPATVYRMNPSMLRKMVQTAMSPLRDDAGERLGLYFPGEEHLGEGAAPLYNLSPLAFLKYDEETAIRSIAALGWKRPDDTDPNSTNCLLNSFANRVHLEQMGFHPYAMELAGLVREGYLAREEALAKLGDTGMDEVSAAVERRLGL